MRPSPLQLKHVFYSKVSVRPNPLGRDAEGKEISALGFDFNGVNIRSTIGLAHREGQTDDPRDFLVNLEISLDGKEGKTAPYLIDVGVVGVINVLPSFAKEKREDLVTVNGASILYGVVREIVLLLTSRFAAGAFTLPGMNFEDTVTKKPTSPEFTNSNNEATGKKERRADMDRRKKGN